MDWHHFLRVTTQQTAKTNRYSKKKKLSDIKTDDSKRFITINVAALLIDLWLLSSLIFGYLVPTFMETHGINTSQTITHLSDTFGAVEALFSGLSLAGIIFALLMQMRELQLQRAELEATRNANESMAMSQEQSQNALSDQVRLLQDSVQTTVESFVGTRQLEIDKIFITFPHLRPYFFNNIEIKQEHEHYNACCSLAQAVANYFDTYFIQSTTNTGQLYSDDTWLSYIETHLKSSAMLRSFIITHRQWFTAQLVAKAELFNRN